MCPILHICLYLSKQQYATHFIGPRFYVCTTLCDFYWRSSRLSSSYIWDISLYCYHYFVDEYCSSEQPFPSDLSCSNLSLVCSPKHKPQASSSANNNASASRYYHPPRLKNKKTRKSINRKRVTGNDQNPSSHLGVGSHCRISRVNNFMDSNQSHDNYQGIYSPHSNYHQLNSPSDLLNQDLNEKRAISSADVDISCDMSSLLSTVSDRETNDKVIFLPASLFYINSEFGKSSQTLLIYTDLWF